jgi:5-(carboxyamino)imidazole ribonucleotide synthase
MKSNLSKNAIIGILGGGQLGRMLAISASRLGFKSHIFDPDQAAPGSQVSAFTTAAPYNDINALTNFAKSVDIVTYEFENIPTEALDAIENYVSIFPSRNALYTSQDRLNEKIFLNNVGLKTAPFFNVESIDDFENAITKIGRKSILKTRRFGYDGKGQIRLTDDKNSAEIFSQFNNQPCILEGLINFDLEISVIGARDQYGSVSCYDPGENTHKNGILKTTTVPAKISKKIATDAIILTGKILNALDYVGVMGVELFVEDNGLIVNEIAPRVHNSGHWTQNGCIIDQFEQHVRAITGLPLGDGTRHSNIIMTNLLGEDVLDLEKFLTNEKSAIHLYGKQDIKPGRKMGHVNKVYS